MFKLTLTKLKNLWLRIVDIDSYEDMLEISNPTYLESIRIAREEIERGDVFTFEEVFGNSREKS